MLDRSITPDFIVPDKFDIPVANTEVFKNGIKCHYISAGDQPIVKLELHYKGGKLYDNTSFNSFFMAKLLTQGTKKRTAEGIAEFIAFHGAYLEITSGNEKVIITLFTISKHLKSLCLFLEEIIEESIFDQEDLDRIKSIEIQNLLVSESKNSFIASEKFREQLFPNHYYNSPITKSIIESIEKNDLKNFHQSYIQNSEMEIFVSGLVTPIELSVIRESFGTSSYKKVIEKDAVSIEESVSGHIQIDKEDSVQSSVRFGFQTIGKTHVDYYKLSVCNEILGGYFGSRLMSNIREDKGYTYGIGSYLVQMKYASFFQISTDVKVEVADKTVEEIQKEINLLCTQEVSSVELTKVRNYLFGSFASSLNTSFDLMDKYKTIDSLGLGYEFYDNYFDALRNVTPQDILETSNKYLLNNAVIVTCG